MKTLNTKEELKGLEYGDHICFLYSNLEEYRDIAIEFIIKGLQNNEKVTCVIDVYPKELLIEELKSVHPATQQFLNSGQLEIASVQGIYNGKEGFETKKAIENWKGKIEAVKEEHFSGFSIFGDMNFILDGKQETLYKLIEYELLSDIELFNRYDNFRSICAFDKTKFPIYVLEDMVRKHNTLINDRKLIKPNSYYLGSEKLLRQYEEEWAFREYLSLDPKDYDNGRIEEEDLKDKDMEILKHVLRTTGDGVWELDMDSKKIYLNDSFTDMIMGSKEENIEDYEGFLKIIHREDVIGLEEKVNNCCKNKIESFEHEARTKDKNGKWVWLNIIGLPLTKNPTNGEILKIVGVFNNITESKRIKKDNTRKEIELKKAKEYDTLKTQFFSSISHDLKTPLNILLGVIQLLNRAHSNSNDSKDYKATSKYIDMMKQNCYRLLRLINNMIDATRADAKLLKRNLSYFNIVDLIENMIMSISKYAELKGIDLIFDTDIEEKIMAVDPDMIERTVFNLLSNSLKFTQPGGQIDVNISDKGDGVSILFRDTGLGIPKDKIKYVFERFKQVNSSKHRENEGTGIGLSLVKAFVEAHNGDISVKSEIGKGTEFIIELPNIEIDSQSIAKEEIAITRDPNVERINIEFFDIYT